MILGIDPGETTGWATINEKGKPLDFGQVKYDDLHQWLFALSGVEVFVIENFRIRPGVNFSWNEMKTIKVIGACEYKAYLLGARVVFQEPADYTVGAKWAGVKIPKDHSQSHQVIAYAHATFYSVHRLGNLPPAFSVVDSSHEKEPTAPTATQAPGQSPDSPP